MSPSIKFTIFGEAASKANSRKLATIGGKVRFIKSAKARSFMDDARRQIPPACRVRLQGPVAVRLCLYYASERPDLDESVVLDAMQDVYADVPVPGGKRRELVQPGVYANDRQVRAKVVLHGIDRKRPRVEIEVRSIAPTEDLFTSEEFMLPLRF